MPDPTLEAKAGMTDPKQIAEWCRPIIGIENRTAQEAFDIMADRIKRFTPALLASAEREVRYREALRGIAETPDAAFGHASATRSMRDDAQEALGDQA